MKKLLFALLFVTSFAYAEIVATLQNQAGGMMYFTNTACSGKNNPYWKILYSTYDGGRTVFGCWFYADGMVHVEWSNGNTSAFNARNLTINYKRGESL